MAAEFCRKSGVLLPAPRRCSVNRGCAVIGPLRSDGEIEEARADCRRELQSDEFDAMSALAC